MNSPQILIVLDEEQEDLFRAAREVGYLGAGHFRGGGHREVVHPVPLKSFLLGFDFRFAGQTFPTEHTFVFWAYSWHGGRNSALGLGEGRNGEGRQTGRLSRVQLSPGGET